MLGDGGLRYAGSSPRVRGTAGPTDDPGSGDRFIPACAGNGRRWRSARQARTVHPRVCGERLCQHYRPGDRIGSSPRVRGTDPARASHQAGRRFIPACAGNGHAFQAGVRGTAVHPRVCGERVIIIDGDTENPGSSPRVRGTDTRVVRGFLVLRFIPACAGNGYQPPAGSCRTPVHPRVCGERVTGRSSWDFASGSSPRVRGTVRRLPADVLRRRFIPACAGNGTAVHLRTGYRPVHPRVCGERISGVTNDSTSSGSSPRVRGTVCKTRPVTASFRFIPACAGNGRLP